MWFDKAKFVHRVCEVKYYIKKEQIDTTDYVIQEIPRTPRAASESTRTRDTQDRSRSPRTTRPERGPAEDQPAREESRGSE